jgi:YD repeat-containing protein
MTQSNKTRVSICTETLKQALGGTMKNAAAAGLALLFLSAPGVFAQSLTPDQLQLPSDEFPAVPDIDRQVGAQGVDVVSGVFSTQSPTIAIGAPGAGGLSYSLLYDGVGMRHSVTGGIAQTGSSSFVVSFMGSAEEFSFVGGAYAPAEPSGSTLTYASGLYTYQTGDGSIVEFRTVPSGIGAVYGYDVAYVERFVAPNGQELSYTYTPGLTRIEYYQTPGGELCITDEGDGGNCQLADQFEAFFRLQSVSSNQGYLLQFEYELDTFAASYDDATARLAVDQWLQLNKIQAINLTEVWCAPTANQCAVGSQWPHMEFDWVQNAQLTPEELTIRDALDNETVWTFDVQGQLTEIDWLTPSGVSRQASKTINYDAEGRVSSISQGGLSWTTTRTETSRVPSIDPSAAAISTLEVVNAAPDGTSTTSYVDRSISRVYETVDAAGGVTSIEYDAHRRPERVTYPEKNAVEYAYDARGNVTSVTQIAKPGSGLADLVTSIDYPVTCTNRVTCNQPTSVTAPDGGVTVYQYDNTHGGVKRISLPPVDGLSPVNQVRYAAQTARFYSAAGQLTDASSSIFLPVRSFMCIVGGTCPQNPEHVRESRFEYGLPGQANNLQLTDIYQEIRDGSESLHTQISYNALGDVISTDGPLPGSYDTGFYQYDALRRQTHMAGPDPDGAGPLPRQAAYVVYDDAGRVEERHSGTVTGADTPNWAFTTVTSQAMEYDELGRPTTARNLTAAGVVEGMLQYSYDSGGRLVCTAQRLNPSAFGNSPTSACTLGQGGVFGTDRIQRVSYDDAGRVNALTDALSEAVVSYAYTANGLQQSLTDGNGNTTLYTYDGFDRQKRIDYAQGETVSEYETFSYDAAGRLSARTNRAEQSFSYGYDALGRVEQVNAPVASENVTYTYNMFNQITSVTSGGETITNSYNALGWLMSQTGPDGAVSYQYDGAGRRERLTWPGADDFYVTYTYDHASRLEEIREMGGTSGLAVLAHYDYDAQGRLESILRGNGVRTGMNYDAASRLEELATELEGSTPSQIRTLNFEYNPAGQITERTDTGGSFAFSGHTDLDAPLVRYDYTSAGALEGRRWLLADERGSIYAHADEAGVIITGEECVNANDGTTTCKTDDYNVTFDTPEGFPGTDESKGDFHYYTETARSEYDAETTRDWVRANPTPGKPDPATPEGTLNDATPIFGGTSPVNISPVTSYVTTNQVTGNEVVVNVTMPTHGLAPGIVVREVVSTGDSSSMIVNYGEGNGILQHENSPVADAINGVWRGQAPPYMSPRLPGAPNWPR